MKIRFVMHYLAVFLVMVVLVVVYGTWPRTDGKLLSRRTCNDSEISPETFLEDNGQIVTGIVHGVDTSGLKPGHDFFFPKETELRKAIRILEHVESGGNADALGDVGLKNKAYGILQIRKPYLDDVNNLFSERIQERWGKPAFDMLEMKESDKARWVAEKYLSHYGTEYFRKTGKEPTVLVYARIHNGGPNGWKKASTNEHARKVEEAIQEDVNVRADEEKGR